MNPSRAIAGALLALLATSPLGSQGADPGTAAHRPTLAVIPFYAPERMWNLYRPLIDYLRRTTGDDWQLALPANHAALIEDLCAGRVDVALLGPVPLARVNAQCGAVPLLVALGPSGAPTYHAELLTTDPEVTAPQALRGRRVGFFRGSTAAHVIPVQMLADAGLPPGAYEPVFLESQDRLIAALLDRRISAAGVKEALYHRFAQEPGLRRLATSKPLPNFAFAALPALSPGVRDRLSAALLRLRPRERAADARLVARWDDEVRNGFAPPGPGFLEEVLSLRATTEKLLGDGR